MNGKALLLTLLVIFATSLTSFAFCYADNQIGKENNLTNAFSITPIGNEEIIEPQGIPIDSPGMPT
jgi:hypothetical protein